MAFRHLSGEPIGVDVALGEELRGLEARQLLAHQLGVAAERLRLVAPEGMLEELQIHRDLI